MKKLFTPFRVGLLVIVSAGVLFVLLNFVKKGGLTERQSIRVYGMFKDASGLGRRSRVQIAGIAVGEVDDIELVGNRAKVWLRIKRSVDLREDASIAKRSESLLGDYMLDLYPGSPPNRQLQDGDEIKNIIDKQGLDAAMDSLSRISADVEQVTYALRKALGGEKGAQSIDAIVHNLESVTAGLDRTVQDNQEKLSRILSDAQAISGDVRGITGRQKENIEKILANVEVVTQDARDVSASLKKILGTGEPGGEVRDTVSQLKDAVAKLDRSIDNIEQVTSKLRDGKGVVGALLTDERMGQKVGEAVEDVADFASRLTQTKTEIGLRTEYGFEQGSAKNTLTVRIVPKPDKYYLLELVDDARDVVEEVVVQSNPPGAGQPASQVQHITRDQMKFTAQFAKRYYFTTLRFGITENTGGIGADLHLFDDHLSFRFDAFNFSVTTLQYPRLRATLRLQLYEHLLITAGVDDILNNPARDVFSNRLISGRDAFIGAGIYFTDDDLKAVLTFIPLPKL